MKRSGVDVVCGVALALALALAGCASVGSKPSAPAQEATAFPVKPGSNFILTADGIVGAEVGRTWSEVSAAFEAEGGYDAEFADNCESYAHRSGKFDAMVVDNTILRIEVSGRDVRTAMGVGIGSSLAELRQAYGDRLIAEKNPYEGEDVQYVWQSQDRGLVFYMSDGKVRFMAGGGDAIRLPEGCH